MTFRLKCLLIVAVLLAYIAWGLVYGVAYFDPCLHFVLGSSVTAANAIKFWFIWNIVPLLLCVTLTSIIAFTGE